MIFAILMVLTTLALAISAGLFSVVGFALTFSSTFWQAIAMGSSMEVTKLVAASFLYRYWKTTPWLLKSIMTVCVAGLIAFTSIGIAGYLTNSFQSSTLDLNTNVETIAVIEAEQQRLLSRKTEVDQQITQLPVNYVTARRQLIESFGPEITKINERLSEIDEQLLELKVTSVTTERDIGPVMFVAKSFGIDPNVAINYFVLVIVLIFDPLAVAMTLATNHVLMERRKLRLSPPPPTTTVAPESDSAQEEVEPVVITPVETHEDLPDEPPTTMATNPLDTILSKLSSMDSSLSQLTAKSRLKSEMRENSLYEHGSTNPS